MGPKEIVMVSIDLLANSLVTLNSLKQIILILNGLIKIALGLFVNLHGISIEKFSLQKINSGKEIYLKKDCKT